MLEAMLRRPPPRIDAMLMEGSSIGRLDPRQRFPMETEVEARLVETMKATPGMVLVAVSAQNIDRVVSIYRAARRNGRALVVDLYAAEILRATGRTSIPQTSWPDVALFTPKQQCRHIVRNQLFEMLDQHKDGRVFPEHLAAAPGRFVVLYRHAFHQDLVRDGCLTGAAAIWSQWDGYLSRDYGAKAEAALRKENVSFSIEHTSGHASIGDLQRLAAAVAPRQLVPIHTFHAVKYRQLFDNVCVRQDGGWWEV